MTFERITFSALGFVAILCAVMALLLLNTPMAEAGVLETPTGGLGTIDRPTFCLAPWIAGLVPGSCTGGTV